MQFILISEVPVFRAGAEDGEKALCYYTNAVFNAKEQDTKQYGYIKGVSTCGTYEVTAILNKIKAVDGFTREQIAEEVIQITDNLVSSYDANKERSQVKRDYQNMKFAELRALCKTRHLKAFGNKQMLIANLIAYDNLPDLYRYDPRQELIDRIIERLGDTEECLITDEHLDCFRQILEEELPQGVATV
jgi:hypothetical protein